MDVGDQQIVSIPGCEVRDEESSDLSLLTGKELDENCFKLDHLGPMVLNQDGSMSRIGNWGNMSEVEKANAARLICRRNKQRAQMLREKRPEVPTDITYDNNEQLLS